MNDHCHLLEPTIELARAAGRKIMQVYSRDFSVSQKDDHTPLTDADLAAHSAIIAGLHRLTPHLPVLSEEAATISFAERSSWSRYWLVDPLDGTREFINRNGEFTVNIALIEQHRAVLGVVLVPVSEISYFACIGHGAYRQAPDSAPVPIRVRSWNGGTPTVVGSRSHSDHHMETYLANLGAHHLLSIGSSLKCCLIAEGEADIYPRLGLTSEWDTAAAQCIVEEAGGRVTDTAMQPLLYNTKASLLNPHFFAFGDVRHDWSRFLPHASP